MQRTLFALIIFLAVVIGVIWLQIFLSKKDNKWLGLILPIVAFLFGLLYPLNMVAPSDGVTVGFIMQMLLVWLLGNIPTIVLLLIYISCRQKKNRNKQLDKMNIQDLDKRFDFKSSCYYGNCFFIT